MSVSKRFTQAAYSFLALLTPFVMAGCSTNNFQTLPSTGPSATCSMDSCLPNAPRGEGGTSRDMPVFDATGEFFNLPAETQGVLSFKDRFGNMALGARILERNSSTGMDRTQFCRRTSAVVPNPTYQFRCYALTSSGEAAHSIYSSMEGTPMFLEGSMFGKGQLMHILERGGRDEKTICQEHAKDSFTSSYACYTAR